MVNKAVITGVSLLLVVGVTIGAVVAVVHIKNSSKSGSESLSPQMKLVTQMCNYTNYQPECQQALSPVAQNSSAQFKDYVKAALLAISDKTKKALNMSESLLVEATNGTRTKLSLEECNDMFKEALDDLQAVFSYVGDADLHTMEDRVLELKIWINSAITYSVTCLDILPEQDHRVYDPMKLSIKNVTAITDNALAIVGEVSSILKLFGVELNDKALNGGRQLMDESQKGGLPGWLSREDRKLMAKQDNWRLTPHVVVAQDGSGQFKSINEALRMHPQKHLKNKVSPDRLLKECEKFVIYVKAGVYNEQVMVTKYMECVYMYGDGPRRTIVTGNKSEKGTHQGIADNASFSVFGNGTIIRGMKFENTAGAFGEQAVALRIQADAVAVFNCHIHGYQDTLYLQMGRQFFRDCTISGHVDFIFGNGLAVIQKSRIVVRKSNRPDQNMAYITAPARMEQKEIGAIILHGCKIIPEKKLFPTRFQVNVYLGRPWKVFARAMFMENEIGDFVKPDGYEDWKGSGGPNTEQSYFGEYKNVGPTGAVHQSVKRANWKGFVGEMKKNEAQMWTVGPALKPAPEYLMYSHIPYDAGFIRP